MQGRVDTKVETKRTDILKKGDDKRNKERREREVCLRCNNNVRNEDGGETER